MRWKDRNFIITQISPCEDPETRVCMANLVGRGWGMGAADGCHGVGKMVLCAESASGWGTGWVQVGSVGCQNAKL